MKNLYLIFILIALISLSGCAASQQNLASMEPPVSQGPETSGEFQQNRDTTHEPKSLEMSLPEMEEGTAAPHAEKKEFGSWEVGCDSMGTDCTAILRVKDKAGKQVLVLVVKSATAEEPNSKPIVTAWLPLEFYIPDHAKVYIGEQKEPFLLIAQYCSSQGCFAISDAPDSFVAALIKQNSGKVTVSMIKYTSNKQIAFTFTQDGFPEAYQHMIKNQ